MRWNRRETVVAGAALLTGCSRAPAKADTEEPGVPPTPLITRPIPASGEMLPIVGLGTWQAFDLSPGAPPTGCCTSFENSGDPDRIARRLIGLAPSPLNPRLSHSIGVMSPF
jgi:hypothetical protein